ncbi:hypothetical protein AB1285_16850 [Microbacterium sp. NRRL B-14842]|uniref:hypothetical protein n=1 Tax=Microbacterium sp. NRRL B-14842 TaxID=3162881 RepID=UPI003D2E6854
MRTHPAAAPRRPAAAAVAAGVRGGLGGFSALALLLALLDAFLVAGDGGRGGVLQRGELRLHGGEVRGLLVERGLRGVGGLLRRDHLLFGDLLQAVALVTGDDGLIAEGLCGVPRGDRVVVDGLVVFEELVHGAEAGEEFVSVGGGIREEQLQRGVVTAVAVELCGDLAGLAGGLVGDGGLCVRLLLQGVGLGDRGEVGLLRVVELGRGDLAAACVSETFCVSDWISPSMRFTSAALEASFCLAFCTSSQLGYDAACAAVTPDEMPNALRATTLSARVRERRGG